ncbi:MAG: hypothetical protein M1839_006430 [Geoglossum umbratile]|nr:MAG: hypothetical protein M1839_006430 [Geoglossum umbratile]
MSGYRRPTQPIVGSHDYKMIQCDNCPNQIPIPAKCSQCGTDTPSLSGGGGQQSPSAPKLKIPCERCGAEFKRLYDKTRHQRYSCPVQTDAEDGELCWCPLRSKESCAERGYRPDKLVDHLRQAHNFERVERSSGGANPSHRGRDQNQVTPAQGVTPIDGDPGLWYPDQGTSLSGQPGQGITGAPRQYNQPRRPSSQLNTSYDGVYPYDSTTYEDDVTASHFPLPAHPLALDGGAGGMGRHYQSGNSTAGSYLSPNSSHVGQASYSTTADVTTPHSRHPRQQYQGQASPDTSSFPFTTADATSWGGSSDSQIAYSYSQPPGSRQYVARSEPGQHRQRRNREDGRQGGRG